MNWSIAIVIWLKGLIAFAIPCLIFFPIGFFAIPITLMISWVAIPIYAFSLWSLKKLSISHKPVMALMLTIGTTLSVTAALYLYKITDSSDEYWGFDGAAFWLPLICCISSVIFSNDSIYCYLNPDAVTQEFATE